MSFNIPSNKGPDKLTPTEIKGLVAIVLFWVLVTILFFLVVGIKVFLITMFVSSVIAYVGTEY